jgi:PAS domain S-box-containing protein
MRSRILEVSMTTKTQNLTPEGELFRDVFNTSIVGIVVENLDGQPLFVNPAFCAMLGYSEEELRSKHCVDFSPAEDAKKDWVLFQQLRAGSIDHYQLEKRYFRRDGSLLWGRLSISLLKNGRSQLVLAMIEDITEKRAAVDREHGLLEMMNSITKQMAAAVTRCSRDFRYLWVNEAYADWIQRPVSEITDRPISEVLGKEAFDSLLPYFRRVLQGETVQYEQETNFQGIGRRWISATYTPTFDRDGATDGWVAVVLDMTDRKRTEETRFKHAAIVESYQDAIISKDLAATITSWNIGAERIFGYKEEEAIGRPITILIPPELWEEENRILDRLRAGGRIEHYETKRLTKIGTLVDVSLNIGPIKDSNGRVVGFTKIAQDITQRKHAEEAVKESEVRFRLVADTAPVLIWMSGTNKLCTYFNKPWLDFTGRSMEQELGNGWAGGVHPDDSQRCVDTYSQSFDRRQEFKMEYRLRHHGGQYRWILDIGAPRFNQDGSFAGYIGSCVDVTERKQAEEAIRISEERLRLAQWAAHIGTFDVNLRTGMDVWQPETEALYGLPPGGFGGTLTAFEDLVHPDDRERVKELTREMMRTGQPAEGEWRVVWPDGSVHWIAGRGQVFMNDLGEPSRMLGVNMDVTERKRADETLSEMTRKLIAAQEQERARIGRELHDDINQRLAMLAVELEQLTGSPSEVESRAQQLRKQISEISNDVQALSHELHASKLDYLGVVSGIRSWCKEFGERQQMVIDFKSDVSSSVPSDVGITLFRVLQEALHNASKYCGVKRIEVELQEASSEIHLVVTDLGRGFDIENAIQGRGLGLTSMQERVRLVKGTIKIQSRPMCGTTIHVRVPLPSAQRAAG